MYAKIKYKNNTIIVNEDEKIVLNTKDLYMDEDIVIELLDNEEEAPDEE